MRESDGASSVICVRLPQDAVEEVFAEAGTQHVYSQPGGGYEIVTQVLPAASMQSVVRSLSGFDASALRVYESGSRSRPVWQFAWYAASDEGGRLYPLQGHLGGHALLRADLQRARRALAPPMIPRRRSCSQVWNCSRRRDRTGLRKKSAILKNCS